MANMKKHPFLQVDYLSTVKLSSAENKKLLKWLGFASEVVEHLVKKKVIADVGIEQIQVSLLICGDSRIKELNREFRRKDKVTDVLSFPAFDDLRKSKVPGKEVFLGDLAICHPQTKRQAKNFEISYFDEFIHLFFHGVLHLMGYDHEVNLKEEKLMEKWENLALEKFSEVKSARPVKSY